MMCSVALPLQNMTSVGLDRSTGPAALPPDGYLSSHICFQVVLTELGQEQSLGESLRRLCVGSKGHFRVHNSPEEAMLDVNEGFSHVAWKY